MNLLRCLMHPRKDHPKFRMKTRWSKRPTLLRMVSKMWQRAQLTCQQSQIKHRSKKRPKQNYSKNWKVNTLTRQKMQAKSTMTRSNLLRKSKQRLKRRLYLVTNLRVLLRHRNRWTRINLFRMKSKMTKIYLNRKRRKKHSKKKMKARILKRSRMLYQILR